jgi:hypothetical protein
LWMLAFLIPADVRRSFKLPPWLVAARAPSHQGRDHCLASSDNA